MRVPYSWLLDYLKTDTPAEELAHILTMGGLEVEEISEWTSEDGQARDQVLHTKITANRGDLLSMVGVARQAAALLGIPLSVEGLNAQPPTHSLAVSTGAPLVAEGDVKVEILDFAGCPRYSALCIRGLKVAESPAWLRYRLEAAGLRPISNVVDVTNYVCWELGQPMHAFDLRLVARNHIIVRRAQPGEELTLIDESVLRLHERDLMICDEMGPIALAGVMGGKDSEMRDISTAVLLESAHFDPVSIRRSAQRHGLSSEASYRFERFVDPNLTLPAIARAAELILQTAGGVADPVALDVRESDFPSRRISLRPARCNSLLGMKLTVEEMAGCLQRLGMEVRVCGAEACASPQELAADKTGRVPADEVIEAVVPTYRPDVEREVDLIEEIAIVHGYDKVPHTVPGRLTEAGRLTARQRFEKRARELLRQGGLNETISFSFMGEQDLDRCRFPADAPERAALQLMLPVSPEMSHLRTTLIPGLLNACSANVRQRVLDVALYEIDRVFLPASGAKNEAAVAPSPKSAPQEPRGRGGKRGEGPDLPQERLRVGGVLMGAPLTSHWVLPAESARADFFWLKGIVEQFLAGLNVQGVEFVRGSHPTFHPGRCAQVRLQDRATCGTDNPACPQVVGLLGEIAAPVQQAYDLPSKTYLFELDLEALEAHTAGYREYDPLPRFPAAIRDIALVVPNDDAHSAATLMSAIRQAGGEHLWTVEAFDLFIDPDRFGVGNKSVAFRMTFRAADRTLTDEDLEPILARIREHLATTLGAQVRDR